jgi:hypothetical protein
MTLSREELEAIIQRVRSTPRPADLPKMSPTAAERIADARAARAQARKLARRDAYLENREWLCERQRQWRKDNAEAVRFYERHLRVR